MNQKIDTKLGIIIIVIFAVTIGVFVWKYEKNKPTIDQPQVVVNVKNPIAPKLPTADQRNAEWKTYKNDKYKFEIQYPSSYIIEEDNNPIRTEYEYSIKFGSLTLAIFKSADGIDNLIKKQNLMRSEIERTSEPVESEKVSDIYARVIKACDIGNYCDKVIYLAHGKYIYSIYMKNYFTIKDATTKENFDRTLASFKFEKTEKVSFCKKIYTADQVVINNIDIAKRIAKIAEKETWICKNMELGKFQESGIGLVQKKEETNNSSYLVNFFHKNNKSEEEDPFNQSPFIFKFDFQNNIILYQNQFSGSFESLGTIK